MKIILLSTLIILVVILLVLCSRVKHSKIEGGAFAFLILGMFIGLLGGFQVFYWLDNTKGWNPYGWWLIATFISTVFGGISGVILFGMMSKQPSRSA